MATETQTHRFATLAIHAGAAPDPATGARAQPIYFTNGFVFEDTQQAADIFAMRRTGFSYSRGSNPTVAALERRVAALEGAKAAVAVASGQSAVLMVLMTDVDMPRGSMDGFALARLVAHRWPTIPVLVVSGMGTPGPHDMPDGARFIPKPYEPSTLVRTLRAFARRAA